MCFEWSSNYNSTARGSIYFVELWVSLFQLNPICFHILFHSSLRNRRTKFWTELGGFKTNLSSIVLSSSLLNQNLVWWNRRRWRCLWRLFECRFVFAFLKYSLSLGPMIFFNLCSSYFLWKILSSLMNHELRQVRSY